MPEKNATNKLLLLIAKDLKEIKENQTRMEENQARMELKIDNGFAGLKSRTPMFNR